MFEFFYAGGNPVGHVSTEARILTFLCGLGLCLWSLGKLRRRSLLVPTCSLFLAVGGVFILFSLFPGTFDRLSYMVGVRYPPILYLVGCIFVLILMIIHLAFRVSLIDERCRRMAQEMAMLHLHHAKASGTDTSVQRTPLSGSS